MSAHHQDGVKLTEAQEKSRRQRSIALGLCLVAFVLIIYVATWAKLGTSVLERSM